MRKFVLKSYNNLLFLFMYQHAFHKFQDAKIEKNMQTTNHFLNLRHIISMKLLSCRIDYSNFGFVVWKTVWKQDKCYFVKPTFVFATIFLSCAMHAAYLKFLPQTIITYWWLFTLCKKDLEGLLAIYTDRHLRKNQSESFGRSSFLLLNNLSFYDLCLVCIQFFKHTEAKIIYLATPGLGDRKKSWRARECCRRLHFGLVDHF